MRALDDELHARPAQPLTAPVRLSRVVMLSGEGAAARAAGVRAGRSVCGNTGPPCESIDYRIESDIRK